jgi:hypothetical protein
MLYKLINGTPKPNPTTATINGLTYGNYAHRTDYWASQGYKPLQGDPRPAGNYRPEYTETDDAIVRSWVEILPTEAEIAKAARIEALRNEYRTATQSLLQLAGEPTTREVTSWQYLDEEDEEPVEVTETVPITKLEDVEHQAVVQLAMAENPAVTMLLTQTIMYALFQLYRLDGNDAWSRM